MSALSFLDGAAPDPVPVKRKRKGTPGAGRPNTYSEEIAQNIVDQIANGKTLPKICEMGPPCRSTVFRWLKEHPDFAEAYGLALRFRAELRMDEMTDIADDSAADYKLSVDKDGVEVKVVDLEHIARVNMRIGIRKYELEKQLPHKYGRDPERVSRAPLPGYDSVVNIGPAGAGTVERLQDGSDPMKEHPLYQQLLAWEKPYVPSDE